MMKLSRTISLNILSPASWLDFSLVALVAVGTLTLIYVSPLMALGLTLGLSAVVYFSNRVHHLLYFLVFYLPLEEFVLKWVDYSIYPALRYGLELVIYGVLAKMVFEKLGRNEKIVSSPIDLPLLFLAALGLLSTFLNGLPILTGLLGLRPLLRYAALFYLILNSDFTKEHLPSLFKVICVIAAIEVVIGIAQYLMGEPANLFLRPKDSLIADKVVNALSTSQDLFAGQKIFATLGRYNLLGGFLACVLLLLLAYRLEKGFLTFNQKLLLAGAIPVFLLTYSRLSWVGFLAGLLALFLIKKKPKLIMALSLVALMVFLAFSSGTTSLYQSEVRGSLKDRLLGPFTSDYWSISSSSQRLFVASEVASNISGSGLLIGYGPGTMGSLVSNLEEGVSRLGELGDPKQLFIVGDVGWINLMGQMGILGLALFGWLIVALFRATLRNYRTTNYFWVKSLALGLLGYGIAMVVVNFFGSPFESRVSSAYFWIMAGVALKQYEQKEN